MRKTNKSYAYAVEEQQGIAFTENTGSAWVKPAARSGFIEFVDDEGQQRSLVLDFSDGFFYNIATRDGASGSGEAQAKTDKVTTAGVAGTNIAGVLKTKEMRGTFEKFFLMAKIFHIYARPESESDGFPTGLEIDLNLYTNGEPTTAAATTKDIPITGDISFDRVVEAHRIQLEIKSNMSEHLIAGWQADDVSEDRPADPDDLDMTEDDWQGEFAEPDVWMGSVLGTMIDRASGEEISATYTAGTGPDSGTDTGFAITTALTLPSTALAGSGTLLVWHTAAITVTIGGVAVVLTAHGTSGGWTLSYANTLTASGAIVVTPTAAGSVSDIRTYVSGISANARGYYYTDVTSNDGKIIIPRV